MATTPKTVQANAQGNAPKGTNIGDTVTTKGGTYKVVAEGTKGASYNPSSGLWSVKVDSTSTSGSSGGSTGGSTGGSVAGSSGSSKKTSGSTQTTYVDDSGNKQQGLYTSDPEEYAKIQQMQAMGQLWHGASPEEQQRLADQAMVIGTSLGATRDKDGVWWKDGQQLYQTQYKPQETPNYYEEYQSQLKDFQSSQQNLLERQYAAALEAAKLNLDSQKTQVNQQYDDLARQLYIQRRQQEMMLPEQMAAMGYTGGITESSALGLQTSYADALRQGETQRINTIASLEQAIRQAELEGNRELAAQLSTLAQSTMGMYGDALAQIQQQANQNQQFTYQQIMDNIANRQWAQQYAYNQQQDRLDRDAAMQNQQMSQQTNQQQAMKENAWMKLQSGVVPTPEELILLGLTQAEAQQMAMIYRNQMMGLY